MTTEGDPVIRLRYVNADHSHPLRGAEGVKVAASTKRGGPRNTLVRLDDGRAIVAPYGNWRKA